MALGTDHVKNGYLTICKFANQTLDTLKDGKFEPKEALLFIDELMLIPEFVNSWPQIIAEFNDIDPVENIEINNMVAAELKIDNARTEKVITLVNTILVSINQIVNAFKEVASKK